MTREKLLEILKIADAINASYTLKPESLKDVIKVIENDPTEEKTAAWVGIDQEPHEVYECNACGWLLYDEDWTDFKYCPNCGARMEVDHADSN